MAAAATAREKYVLRHFSRDISSNIVSFRDYDQFDQFGFLSYDYHCNGSIFLAWYSCYALVSYVPNVVHSTSVDLFFPYGRDNFQHDQ